jgi:hypothetical protein
MLNTGWRLSVHQKLENNMDESKLEVTIREAQNGWVVELNREGETMEYIFTRPNPAINLVRKVMKGELDPVVGDDE